jgi:small subunit ribosomal protein S7
MSRKKTVFKKHQQADDPRFPHPLAKQLITKIMLDGKKSEARKIFYQTSDYLKEETGQDPLVVFEEAVKELSPQLETKKERRGGSSQLIPKKVGPERGVCLALRWLVEAARRGTKKKSRKGTGKPMYYCLAQEILKARQKEGEAFKKKETEQQKAKDSIAFASFSIFHS